MLHNSHSFDDRVLVVQPPWPIMNDICKESFEVYNSVFTVLLQFRRVKYKVERLTLLKKDFRTLPESGERTVNYSLKHRLFWFVNIVYYYLIDLVPNHHILRRVP